MRKIIAILSVATMFSACTIKVISETMDKSLTGKTLYTLNFDIKEGRITIYETAVSFISDTTMSTKVTLYARKDVFLKQGDEDIKQLYDTSMMHYAYKDYVLSVHAPGRAPYSSTLYKAGEGIITDSNGGTYYTTSMLGHLNSPATKSRINKLLGLSPQLPASTVDSVMKLLNAPRDKDGNIIQ
ncbi:hypothetical protein ACE38W_12320 [Chitinophaga sp. Hz27]|uniref:hypothetical protein n=1 Tax=Chitinophaga sp. Hz27 TaxID=3347169 RepID=UPI0035DCF9C5